MADLPAARGHDVTRAHTEGHPTVRTFVHQQLARVDFVVLTTHRTDLVPTPAPLPKAAHSLLPTPRTAQLFACPR